MNILRTLPLVFLVLVALAPRASAAPDAIATAWVQGEDVDAVYDASDVQRPARDIRVEVWHQNEQDERPYRRGESYELYFESNSDAYVVVYRIDVEGDVEVLWPTSRFDDGFVYGNHVYTLPRQGSPIRLTAGQRKGVEYVQVIASELPFDLRRLSIDFRFDMNDPTDYGYRISGDPFLAVNDINFAITGLEEDVDYVVTDWAHLYVESQVDYARYTCTQCHAGDDGEVYTSTVRPYVDECTTVNVYADWGWQRRWHVDFGWYPLYYEPAYYYWDSFYGRPYWFSYYPVYYSWPRYPVYTRPYYWYAWHDSPWYGGDYRVRYKRGHEGTRLYDFDRIKTRTRNVPGLGDVASGRAPASIDRIRPDDRRDRVSAGNLVRDRAPSMVRTDLNPRTSESLRDRRTRTGIREDRRSTVREERRLTSLTAQREARPGSGDRTRAQVDRDRGGRSNVDRTPTSTRTERRWTRPVIRNEDRDRRGRSSVDRQRDTGTRDTRRNIDRTRPRTQIRDDDRRSNTGRDRAPEVRRNTPTRERSVDRDRATTPRRNVDRERTNTPRRKVERDRSSPPRRQVERKQPTRQRVEPKRSAPTRQQPQRSNGGSRGGKSRTKERGGGGRG